MTGRSGPIDRTLALNVRSRDSRHVSPASNAVRQISTVAKLTGRSGKTDRTLKPQRPVVSSKLPEACFFDRTRPVHLDRTQPASGAQPLATVQTCQFDRTQKPASGASQVQRPVQHRNWRPLCQLDRTQPFSVRSLSDPASGQ